MSSSRSIRSIDLSRDQKKLKKCLHQAIDPIGEDVNEEDINLLIKLVRDDKHLITFLLVLFVPKIQSYDEDEAMKALNVLQCLVKRANKNFVEEVARVRFLNELLKLISRKFFAQRTSERLKKKVGEILYRWSIDYENQPKMWIAYDVIKDHV